MTRKDFKSDIEYYFWLYCIELKEAGFIKSIEYETSTFALSPPYKRDYLKQLKSKIVIKEEHLLQKSSITADFSMVWYNKAENIFYLNPEKPISCNIKEIPFRLCSKCVLPLVSYIETKGMSESTTSSSISFPLKQKQCVKDHGVYIQKIKPYWPKIKSGILFQQTFTPKKVLELEVYKRDCKWGKKGESKIKYPYRTLEEYLKMKL